MSLFHIFIYNPSCACLLIPMGMQRWLRRGYLSRKEVEVSEIFASGVLSFWVFFCFLPQLSIPSRWELVQQHT